MINLDQIYIGNNQDKGKPSTIALHDMTMDISAPNYKRGADTTVSYSNVKYVCANEGTLTLKILRTEVILSGFNPGECADIAKIIEIGRRESVKKSKAFKSYIMEASRREAREAKAAERREAREAKAAERREAREAKIAAVSNVINRYTESRAINRDREDRREQAKEDKISLAKEHILGLLTDFCSTEEQIASKQSELAMLFNKYFNHSEEGYEELSDKVLEIYRENIAILDEKFPDSETAKRSRLQLERLDGKKKEKDKRETALTIKWILLLVR